VDRHLVDILTRAISFHPRDRFSQAGEMLVALKPNFNKSQSKRVTRATVKVSPAISNRNQQNFPGTVAYKEAQSTQQSSTRNWLSQVFLFLLVTGGLTFGAFALGFYSLSNWWQSRPQSSPQVTEQPDISEPIVLPPEEELEQPQEEIETTFKIGELKKEKKNKKERQEQQPAEIVEATETPSEDTENTEIANQLKPEPEPEPKPLILATGTSENQLVNTLGQPSSQRNEPRKNSKVLVYNNATSNNVNLTYHSDSSGQIKQADVALNSDVSLGAMQDTLTQLLGGNAPADAKDKLRTVYNRQASLQSFRVGNLQGQIQRDSKDRVSISVWESGY
jgi:serine/threonine protein kinase, bacterial